MISQLLRFGAVGIAAMLIHWLTVVALVPLGSVPLLANVAGFGVAFQVSYWGHRHWTFNANALHHRQTLPRFVVVSCSSFAVNEFLYFLLLRYTALDYRTALTIVLAAVATATFF